VGSNLITKKLLDTKDYAGLRANVREAISLARRLKAELATKP
jgi:2-dehydro-3-deoxyphosphogluconate aldolase/(4S)-4-hydroxy-2-oxoglutarate aldolase